MSTLTTLSLSFRQRTAEESPESKSGGVAEGRSSHRIVPAGQRHALELDTFAAHFFQQRIGEFRPERGIVTSGNQQDFLAVITCFACGVSGRALDPCDVRKRADRRPEVAEFVMRDSRRGHGLPYVFGGNC